ncbi:hypothetical protein SCP_1003640 [Sparassis crispa]|uniref:Uncharacterized protein n=1 Tax=Sparassis crispa TaxID=139825 RepID=A0A401GY37_9APHY|nr:hypothetical protein SCP_1003640 [Sparassis crispa]GBE87117.1 hypothetical protein SCP_1003640 [Sparassis crispa]
MEAIATLPNLLDIRFLFLPSGVFQDFARALKSTPMRLTLFDIDPDMVSEDNLVSILNYMRPSDSEIAVPEPRCANEGAVDTGERRPLPSLSCLQSLYVSLLLNRPRSSLEQPLAHRLAFPAINEVALVNGFLSTDVAFQAFRNVRRLTLRLMRMPSGAPRTTQWKDLDYLNASPLSFVAWTITIPVSWLELDLDLCYRMPELPWVELRPVAVTVHRDIRDFEKERDLFWQTLAKAMSEAHTVRSFELTLTMDRLPRDLGNVEDWEDVSFLRAAVSTILQELADANVPLMYLRVFCVLTGLENGDDVRDDAAVDPVGLIPQEVQKCLPGVRYLSLGVGKWHEYDSTMRLPVNDPKWRYSWWRFSENDEKRRMPAAVGERLRKEMFGRECDFESLAMRELELSTELGYADGLQI